MKYEVGQTITIRQWEAMEKGFGLMDGGSIVVKNLFTKEMRYLCGQKLTICEKYDNYYVCKDAVGRFLFWNFTDDMIEHNFNWGEEIEVSDDGVNWYKRIFVGYIDSTTSYCRFIARDMDIFCGWYVHARKLQKEPSIDITIKINGKEAKLSDISEETLKRLREV